MTGKPATINRAFERVAVVNLDRRPERWQEFLKTLPANWPFRPPLRFPAVDGEQHSPPGWWHGGAGAWGCYLSHLHMIEDALADGVDSLLLLEDDALFSTDFVYEAQAFMDHLPSDWQLLYFGGQHIQLHEGFPKQVNQWVYQPFNVNRTHAYAIRGKSMLSRVRDHLLDTGNWTAQHHVDHHMGELHKQMPGGIYVPRNWLVAQRSGKSDIAGQQFDQRGFQGAEALVHPELRLPMVAVLGPFSGGTSVVAGLLHRLGIPMGRAFTAPDATNATGNFEAQQLARHCRTFFQEPWLTEQVCYENRRQLLTLWAANHTEHFRSCHRLAGAKHPTLCLMGREITEAWHPPYLIAVDRDYDEVVNSLTTRNWGWPLEACLLITQQLIQARDVFLASTDCPVIRIAYHDVLNHPAAVITKLCEFLDHQPTAQVIEAAKKLVQPR